MPAAATLPFLPATASVGDPSATRTVYITVVLLVVLAAALAVLAVWLFKRTRPEPQLLAPLEEMDSRAWRRQDPAGQRRALDASRPPGARPVHREAAEPDVDTEFAAERPVQSFDDLSDDPAPDDATDDADNAGADVDTDGSPGDDVSDGDVLDGDDRRVTVESAVTVERANTDAVDATDGEQPPSGDLDATDDDETVDFALPDDRQGLVDDDVSDDDETVGHERSADAAQTRPEDGAVGRTRTP